MVKILSLDKPIGFNKDGKPFTLLDLIPSKVSDDDILDSFVEPKPKRYAPGFSIKLRQDEINILRNRYPGIPLQQAFRSILGLLPLEKGRHWQLWEIAILIKLYPESGVIGVQQYLNRSRNQIYHKAGSLGLCTKSYPYYGTDLVITCDVARIFQVSRPMIIKLVREGYFHPARVSGRSRGHFLFQPKEVYQPSRELCKRLNIPPNYTQMQQNRLPGCYLSYLETESQLSKPR